MAPAVVGREGEIATIEAVLDAVGQGPAGCYLYGDPGIGKTTLWRAALERAASRGYTVLACRAAQTEARLSYASVADLLTQVDEAVIASLPIPQRDAAAAAVLRRATSGAAVDPRSVAMALLTAVRALSARAPVVIGIDDIQWVDKTSAQAIAFAARRMEGPFGFVAAARTSGPDQLAFRLADDEPIKRVKVGPLAATALEQVIRTRTGKTPSKSEMSRLFRISGGNPFYAIEVVMTADLSNASTLQTELPPSLLELTKTRLGRVDTEVRRVLLAAAALAAPTVELLTQLIGPEAAAVLGRAESLRLIEVVGPSIRFLHPMIAAGAYALATPARRRAMHRQLADLPLDIEERARHLGLSATGPDPEVISALDAAAYKAAERGAPAAAAELLDLAVQLGAVDPDRKLSGARFHFDAGDSARARATIEHLIPELPRGGMRARALSLLATVRLHDDNYRAAAELLEDALRESSLDDTTHVQIELDLAFALYNVGSHTQALAHTDAAVARARTIGLDRLIARALALSCALRFLTSEPWEQSALDTALALEDKQEAMTIEIRPSMIAGLMHMWCGRVDEAHEILASLRTTFLERGAESDLVFTCFHLEAVECWRGAVESAREVADDAFRRASQLGTPVSIALALSARSHSAAYAGDTDQARHDAEQSLAILNEARLLAVSLLPQATLGFVELSLDEFDAAANRLAPMVMAAITAGVREPSIVPFTPDAAEALIRADRVVEAEEIVRWLEDNGRRTGRLWVIAVAKRCRSLLLAKHRRLTQAMEVCEQAVHDHADLPMPFERARTLLVLGQLQRRAGKRRAAEATLGAAQKLFASIGAPLWTAKANRELARLGLRPTPAQLTPSEHRVALLAASGHTNKVVAAEMMISPKTVEAHLARVYQKLHIRSRAELGRVMAERARNEPTPADDLVTSS